MATRTLANVMRQMDRLQAELIVITAKRDKLGEQLEQMQTQAVAGLVEAGYRHGDRWRMGQQAVELQLQDLAVGSLAIVDDRDLPRLPHASSQGLDLPGPGPA